MEFDRIDNPLKRARQGKVRARAKGIPMDMNAMVDIAFLLLTFFMLTTTMVKPKAIEMVMPAQQKEAQQPLTQEIRESRALTVIALPGNQLVFYRGFSQAKAIVTTYGKEGVRSVLKNFVAAVEEPVVLLKSHPDSVFENLVDLLDELALSGVTRYTIETFDDRDKKILEQSGVRVP
ncbi:MAG TPA: biopolymer transporter ExbD [Lacibacter sp.]|nr:biopolymer transporter ExbD [Lacibacter sp.]HMP86361.1 biopolymer transporter ExbD [Lacibacter sp.]